MFIVFRRQLFHKAPKQPIFMRTYSVEEFQNLHIFTRLSIVTSQALVNQIITTLLNTVLNVFKCYFVGPLSFYV